jgi:hypothetical protein
MADIDEIMTNIELSSAELRKAVLSFDSALSALEKNLNIAVEKMTEVIEAKSSDAVINGDKSDLVLREELANARAREQELEHAINEARSALGMAIDDIRIVLGPV